ncbi:MAG: hypothetical protein KDC25_02585, partial [Saprospiraceae bacterium]|nr:hypothetical protein [Saprospiraceae bacterium]
MNFFYYFSIVTFTFLSTIGNLNAQTYVEIAVNTALTEKGSVSCVLVFEPLLLKNKISTDLTK